MAFVNNKHNVSTGLQIYFVRHAESLNNIRCRDNPEEYETLRFHDPELTPEGYEQAAKLAAFFKYHESHFDVCESKF